MRIELTVRHERGCTDVAVAAPAPVTLAAIAAELAEVVGIVRDAELWNGARRLAPTALVGGTELRAGSVLDVGGSSRDRSQPGVLALHQVGGLMPGA